MSGLKPTKYYVPFDRENRLYHSTTLPVQPVYFPNRQGEFQNVDWDATGRTQPKRSNLQYRRSDGHLHADNVQRQFYNGGERLRYQRPATNQQTVNEYSKAGKSQTVNINPGKSSPLKFLDSHIYTSEAKCEQHNTIREHIKTVVTGWKAVAKDLPKLKPKTNPDIPVRMLINILENMDKHVSKWKKETRHLWGLKSEFKGTESVNSSNELREALQKQTLMNEARAKEAKELTQRLGDLRQEITQLTLSSKQIAMEKEEALMRLNEISATNLIDKNVEIADLSTEIRPTRIAEDFREIYDNEWTAAIETFTEQDEGSEKRIIALLLHVVTDSFEFTRKEARKTLTRLKSVINDEDEEELSGSHWNRETEDLMLRLRKSESQKMAPDIIKKFLRRLDTDENFEHPLHEKVRAYASKCAQITWYMNVQIPPMGISYQIKHGDAFDAQAYSEYTQRGTVVDFVVWPAVHMAHGGKLICRGVTQPIKESWAL